MATKVCTLALLLPIFTRSLCRALSHQSMASSSAITTSSKLIRISESSWRSSASAHQNRIRELLGPGLTKPSDSINSGINRQTSRSRKKVGHDWTALDSKNPIFNFLIEYYGLKGAKGPRRLARWSPDPSLLLLSPDSDINNGNNKGLVASADGILLEGADFETDMGDTLHMRGALPHEDGIVYNPSHFFGKGEPTMMEQAKKAVVPYLWYRSVLQQTLIAEPILHCFGLHEWAMQYQPEGAPEPPSAKYQTHLSLRVPRNTINQVVERKGVHCTHVDALRYFAPAAGPLNHHGANLQRTDQLRLEQPACVHAHMDLIRISLRLQPFLSAELLCDAVEIALRARKLDVAASPYDATMYGVGIVPIETPEGRAQYKAEQKALMHDAEIVRRAMLQAYDTLLHVAFDAETIGHAENQPDPERYASAQPGGLPWRKNLVSR